ncbi:MAG TPA: phosphoglycerate mutase family protein [Ilumatobacteraceae bacterium]|nr:phosphoglycerate mutase family protein [Ilumatobacteraceae bacterium]
MRHAKAGSRQDWVGDDRERPLTAFGRQQAEALRERLAPLCTGLIISSPYLRCVQTVQPLADRLGRSVAVDDRLAEEQGFSGALELLAELADGSVLCSHGDVIPETIDALVRRGCLVSGKPDWRKASVWVLHREADGTITRAGVWPPPEYLVVS